MSIQTDSIQTDDEGFIAFASCQVLCVVLQSGGDLSNDEHLADKLTSLLHTALRAHQSNADIANATSFKRLAGLEL